MTRDEQLRLWAAGELDGKGEAAHLDSGDCCPDFACCHPENAASAYDRQRFVDADDREREGMLVGFLAAALERHYDPGSVVSSADATDEEGEEWKRGAGERKCGNKDHDVTKDALATERPTQRGDYGDPEDPEFSDRIR